jgi:hypothetical protein
MASVALSENVQNVRNAMMVNNGRYLHTFLNCTHSVRRSFLLASQPPAFMPSKWHPNHGNNEIIMELEA